MRRDNKYQPIGSAWWLSDQPYLFSVGKDLMDNILRRLEEIMEPLIIGQENFYRGFITQRKSSGRWVSPQLEVWNRNTGEIWSFRENELDLLCHKFEINKKTFHWLSRSERFYQGDLRIGYEQTPLYMPPNLRKMTILKLGTYKALKTLFGMQWVTGRRYELYGWRLRDDWKYLSSQYRRLYDAKTPAEYWKVAMNLIRNSKVLRLTHLSKAFPKWEREMSIHTVKKILEEVDRKLYDGSWVTPEIHRVWIESSGKRPLGVPSPADRVIGSMFTNLFEYYLRGVIKNNHAYQMGKGTGTVWQEILSRVIHAKEIYEFDLEGFFNNIQLEQVNECLKYYELPEQIRLAIMSIQSELPRNLEVTEEGYDVSESSQQMRAFYRRVIKDTVDGAKKTLYYNPFSKIRGVSQGHNLSPLCAILVLEYLYHLQKEDPYEAKRYYGWSERWYNEPYYDPRKTKVFYKFHLTMYADDGLLWGDKVGIKTFKKMINKIGVRVSETKSGWIKREGTWIRDFIFCGLRFDPEGHKSKDTTTKAFGTLSAHTRKGKRITLDRSFARVSYNGEFVALAPNKYFIFTNDYLKLGEWHTQERYLPMQFFFVMLVLGLHFLQDIWDTNWLGLKLDSILFMMYIIWTRADFVLDVSINQITWWQVLRAGYLNKFMARMYSGSLEDVQPPRATELKIVKGSLLDVLNHKLKWKHKLGRDLSWPSFYKDIDIYNSSTVGYWLMLKLWDEIVPKYKGPHLSVRGYLEKRLNFRGRWIEVPPFEDKGRNNPKPYICRWDIPNDPDFDMWLQGWFPHYKHLVTSATFRLQTQPIMAMHNKDVQLRKLTNWAIRPGTSLYEEFDFAFNLIYSQYQNREGHRFAYFKDKMTEELMVLMRLPRLGWRLMSLTHENSGGPLGWDQSPHPDLQIPIFKYWLPIIHRKYESGSRDRVRIADKLLIDLEPTSQPMYVGKMDSHHPWGGTLVERPDRKSEFNLHTKDYWADQRRKLELETFY